MKDSKRHRKRQREVCNRMGGEGGVYITFVLAKHHNFKLTPIDVNYLTTCEELTFIFIRRGEVGQVPAIVTSELTMAATIMLEYARQHTEHDLCSLIITVTFTQN